MTVDELIKRHEALRLELYDDKTGRPVASGSVLYGKMTGGWGHNFTDDGVSHEVADALFIADRHMATAEAITVFGRGYFTANEPRQAALIDMAFNLGQPRLAGFHNMITAVLAGDWDTAAREALDSEWAHQVGVRAVEDAEILRTGNWPPALVAQLGQSGEPAAMPALPAPPVANAG